MVRELNIQSYGDRLPPQNIEAEESILGGILLDPEAISRVAEVLRPEAFYISAHREIYSAMQALYAQSQPTDLIGVTGWLSDRDLLEKVGGQTKLAQLVDRTVSATNVDRYAWLVMDKYLRRQLIKSGNEIAQLGYESATPLEQVLDRAEQKIFGITQSRPQQALVPIYDTLIHAFQEIEVQHEGQSLPGLLTDFYDLDGMTSGLQRSDLVIVAGRPSMGKCLAATAEIVLENGAIATIEEIYNARRGRIFTLQNNWQFAFTSPSDFIDDGIKPVYRVTTRLGRTIETTITHPYLTIAGWKRLETLNVGDRIAVPRQLEVFGKETINGDRLENLVAESRDRQIPNIVFQLTRSQVSLFLNRLFSTDGWISVLAHRQVQLGYCTVSEKLARQAQHLLLRFGIIATLKKRSVKYKPTQKQAWQLDITDAKSIKAFIDEIGIFGKEEAIFKAKVALQNCNYQTHHDLIPIADENVPVGANGVCPIRSVTQFAENDLNSDRNIQIGKRSLSRDRLFVLATALENLPLQQLATSAIYWDEIVAIEFVGNQQVYDLTIPETHNFVANDICVHNTAMSLNVAYNVAARYKLPVAVFSLEMSKEQLVQRLLASEAGIESNRLRAGRISQNEWEPLSRAIGTLSELPIFIDDTANLTVTEMRSKARRLQAERGGAMGLILLDYLQLMEGSGGSSREDSRTQELSRITRSLKGLARELNVPVIALSQLSRGVEARTNKRPMMSDLRESGSIEQDADLVLMLYRDEYYYPDTPDRGITEIIIAKHRNGPTGVVKLLFDPQYTKFRNLAAPSR